eukprot:g1558.t1
MGGDSSRIAKKISNASQNPYNEVLEQDAIVVGFGISGINAAYYLRTLNPSLSFSVLERSSKPSGTWNKFNYPGIRSDSDMWSYAFSYEPWTSGERLASAEQIRRYLDKVIDKYKLADHVLYNHEVVRINFDRKTSQWTLYCLQTIQTQKKKQSERKRRGKSRTGRKKTKTAKKKVENCHAVQQLRVIRCKYLFCCTGYYSYSSPHLPNFPKMNKFKGQLIHSQNWTEEDTRNVSDKKVVVIGSGATAITTVPYLSNVAKHVTMLQRSPSYFYSVPKRIDPPFVLTFWGNIPGLRALNTAIIFFFYWFVRWFNIVYIYITFHLCILFPDATKGLLTASWLPMFAAAKGDIDINKDFTPRYPPWHQRVCVCINHDFFKALSSQGGTCTPRAKVITDEIKEFTEDGIILAKSGQTIHADVVMACTGMNLEFGGGMEIRVNDNIVDLANQYVYRGCMITNVPNFFFFVGYVNASWTLKIELSTPFVCKLIDHLETSSPREKKKQVEARKPSSEERKERRGVKKKSLMGDFTPGYVMRIQDKLPKQCGYPWNLDHDYLQDYYNYKIRDLVHPTMAIR